MFDQKKQRNERQILEADDDIERRVTTCRRAGVLIFCLATKKPHRPVKLLATAQHRIIRNKHPPYQAASIISATYASVGAAAMS